MSAKRTLLASFLLLLISDPAQAYVDPATSRVVSHLISGMFIVISAAFIFLKSQVVRLLKSIRHILGRLLRRGRGDREA
jgi:hypothetical protein